MEPTAFAPGEQDGGEQGRVLNENDKKVSSSSILC
jgi:hypothetical protein